MSVLSLAIPSKGRLKEKSEAFLMEQGFEVRQIGGERGYQAEITGLGEVDMRLLSAREIAQGIIDGTIHAGVTGEDLLHDLAPTGPEDFHVAERLGFGGADVIVAVPRGLDRCGHDVGPGGCGRGLPEGPSSAFARCDQVYAADAALLRGEIGGRIPARRKCWRHRSRTGDRGRRRHRGHHLHRGHAEGERAQNCFRWNNFEKRGRFGSVCECLLEPGGAEVPVVIARCSKN